MPILYTFYGDDLTGSTDVLEQLGSNGVPSVLFLGSPSAAQLAEFPGVQAVGIAGDSRSRSPEWMLAHLPAIFERLRSFGAPVMHYKVCSTFDSSATIGSIGRAIEIGIDTFSPAFVPVVVGAPHLRRYVAFGNLFAADPDGIVRRIDRHPMSRHPVTPMHEADLRLHLAAQSEIKVGLIDTPALRSGRCPEAVASLISSGHAAILFDTIDTDTQSQIGLLVWKQAQPLPIFCVGSSGLTASLISAWRAAGMLAAASVLGALPTAKPLLVASGSCSETTQRQIRFAIANGYRGIAVDPIALLERNEVTHRAVLKAAQESLAAGHDTVLYSALGPPAATVCGERLGVTLGSLVRDLLAPTISPSVPTRRVIFCGGDTASHAVQKLGLYALTWAANLQPGVPLCRAHANSELNGLELVLKGGQVGSEDFFNVARGG